MQPYLFYGRRNFVFAELLTTVNVNSRKGLALGRRHCWRYSIFAFFEHIYKNCGHTAVGAMQPCLFYGRRNFVFAELLTTVNVNSRMGLALTVGTVGNSPANVAPVAPVDSPANGTDSATSVPAGNEGK